MLFKASEHRCCVNCALSAELDEDRMICKKKGIVDKDRKCRHFLYDPLKRDPARPRSLAALKSAEHDFSL